MKRLVLMLALVVAGPLSAQTTNTAGANSQLFDPDRETVQLSSSLSKKDQAALKKLLPLLEQQMQRPVDYYSTIAYAPDQGLVSEALQGAFNYHSPAAADRAALRACSQAKPAGAGECRIAARVLPRGFKERAITLSADATRVFQRRFSRLTAPKVFAISPTSGAWGIGSSDSEAISGCGKGGASDCRAVIRD